jgi:hypothetical protein
MFLFEGLPRSATSTRRAARRSSGYYVCASCGLQAGETGFYNALRSLEAVNLACSPPLITNANIGKVFHARLCSFFLCAFAKKPSRAKAQRLRLIAETTIKDQLINRFQAVKIKILPNAFVLPTLTPKKSRNMSQIFWQGDFFM